MNYPKNREDNVGYRIKLMKEAQDMKFRASVKRIFEENPLFAFNTFFWTYDPRESKDKDLPFTTYKYQDDFILELNRCIDEGEDFFCDKSRDMGVTWMVIGVFVWRFLTKRGEQLKIGSWKQEYVDRLGDMSTHFEKMRYLLSKLPKWLLPEGFDLSKHSTFMKIIAPSLSNALIGEATNADFARGGREKAIALDEFQSWDMANEAWRSCSDATRCKIVFGTPKGAGNKFAELSRTSEIKSKHRLKWFLHPKKAYTGRDYLKTVEDAKITDRIDGYIVQKAENQEAAPSGCYIDQYGKIRSEWYDRECERRSREDILENLDCNYLTSGNPVFDVLKCEERMRDCKSPLKIGDLLWKVRPIFNESGTCVNKEQLSVEFLENMNGLYLVWELPEEGWENAYSISADVAEGLEQGDWDSASVRKRFVNHDEDVPLTVCTLHTHIKPFEFAEELAKLGYWYKKAWIAPERQGNSGGVVINELLKIYTRIYHKEVITKGYPQSTDKIGFDTSNRHMKGMIIGELSKQIVEGTFRDYDTDFWKECLTFVNNDGKMEAQGKGKGEKCFDDRVMDRAINAWVDTQLPNPYRTRGKVRETDWQAIQKKHYQNKALVGWVVR